MESANFIRTNKRESKGCDHVTVSVLDSHPKAVSLTWVPRLASNLPPKEGPRANSDLP